MEQENYLGIILTKNNTKLYLVKHIGEGATSHVYLALDKYKKEYALKLYKNSESYFTEINKIKKIFSSQYIVKLISYGQGFLERGYSYLSYKLFNHFQSGPVEYGLFEYLKNGELHNYVFLLKKKFSEEIAKKIFYEILLGLETCHESGMSHGDIKLQNILFNSNFGIKLIDLGFAKKIKEGLISEITGSKYYNAPEMFSCATKGYDGVLADIFSLGVVLFVLVMGFYPFDKPNMIDSRYKLIFKKDFDNFWKKCEQKKISSDKYFSGVSKEFKDLFEKMVCPKPKERISLCQIKKHSWLQEIVKFYEDYSEIKEKIEMNKKFDKKKQSSPKKNSIKYLSYNPSFNKEEKKCLQNEKLDNVSNHSDDINQKKRIKNKSLNFYSNENKKNIIIVKNSLQKEFENKYLKELSSRKLIIDKILKEQEDDGD
jgi:serine/threonine protein kinase